MGLGGVNTQQFEAIDSFDDWVERAAAESFKVATTPPFCESAPWRKVLASPAKTSFLDQAKCDGKFEDDILDINYGKVVENIGGNGYVPLVTVYRLDVFGTDPDFYDKIANIEDDGVDEFVVNKLN